MTSVQLKQAICIVIQIAVMGRLAVGTCWVPG